MAFIGSEFFYRLVGFATAIMVVRSLTGEIYGQFSFVYVFISFFEVFVQFGFNAILTREVAQKKDQVSKILGNAILFRFALCLVAIPLAYLMIKIMGYPLTVQHGVMLASIQLLLTIRAVFETIYRVNLQMIYPGLWNGLRAILSLIFVWLVAIYQPGILLFIGAYLLSGFISFIGFLVL